MRTRIMIGETILLIQGDELPRPAIVTDARDNYRGEPLLTVIDFLSGRTLRHIGHQAVTKNPDEIITWVRREEANVATRETASVSQPTRIPAGRVMR